MDCDIAIAGGGPAGLAAAAAIIRALPDVRVKVVGFTSSTVWPAKADWIHFWTGITFAKILFSHSLQTRI